MTNLIAQCGSAVRTFAGDVAQGFFEIAHNGFAVVGLVLAFLTSDDGCQTRVAPCKAKPRLMGWLQARQPVVELTDGD